MDIKILKVIGGSQNRKQELFVDPLERLFLLEFYCFKKISFKKATFSYGGQKGIHFCFLKKFYKFFLNLSCLHHLPASNKKNKLEKKNVLTKLFKVWLSLVYYLFFPSLTMTMCLYNCDLRVNTHSSQHAFQQVPWICGFNWSIFYYSQEYSGSW